MSRARALPLLSFLLFTNLVAADVPVASAERGRAPFGRSRPRIASDGRGFLAVWSDGRSGQGFDVRARVLGETRDIVLRPVGSLAQDVASNG
ncbi:MAG: hypothetical protein JOZ54_14515, partial [Acidobacteria bacterium]|nr:hypothetical protein [Acidobacteriota bacterium]